MAEIFRPSFKDRKTGQKKVTKCWYARIQGKRVPLKVTDKRIAQRKADELERQAVEGGHDPARLEKARRRPILEHLVDFVEALKAKGAGPRHLENVEPRIRKVIAACSLRTLADANAEKIESWLAHQERDEVLSVQTRKHYAVHLRQFGKWLVDSGRIGVNPFRGLRTDLNVQAHRKHKRGALTPSELGTLLANTAASPVRRCKMKGPHRCMLYRVALGTGLRRDELGVLTPASFNLAAEPPVVTVEGAFTKNGKLATLPLRRDLADCLQEWLRGRKPDEVLFPIKGKQTNYMIRADLEAAGLPYIVGGNIYDFHALRVTFVSHLALVGVPLAVAQKLARHSDPRLTANTYTQLSLVDLSRAVETLPGLMPMPPAVLPILIRPTITLVPADAGVPAPAPATEQAAATPEPEPPQAAAG